MATPKIGDRVRCEWFDAWSDHETTSPADWDDECRVVTYGILVRVDGDVVSIAQEVVNPGENPETDDYRCVTHIPWAIVESLVKL
jgi:hypothetical protein